MTQLYADSTVAMSAYNLLATNGGPMSRHDVYGFLVKTVHPGLKAEQLDRAMTRLNELKLIAKTHLGDCTKDARRRLIIVRNRSDMVKRRDGSVSGGWTGWRWRDANGKMGDVFNVKKTICLNANK